MSSKTWPQDYQQWEGSLPELVQTAQSVLEAIQPDAKAPSERLVRHYKTKGLIQAKGRAGHADRYGYDALAAVVATKSLVKQGFTLNHASHFVNSSSATEYLSSAPVSNQAPSAVALVSELLARADQPLPMAPALTATTTPQAHPLLRSLNASVQAQGLSAAPTSSMTFGGMNAIQGALSNASEPLLSAPMALFAGASMPTKAVPAAWTQQQPTPWLSVAYDAAALNQATTEERQAAARALETLARAFRRTS